MWWKSCADSIRTNQKYNNLYKIVETHWVTVKCAWHENFRDKKRIEDDAIQFIPINLNILFYLNCRILRFWVWRIDSIYRLWSGKCIIRISIITLSWQRCSPETYYHSLFSFGIVRGGSWVRRRSSCLLIDRYEHFHNTSFWCLTSCRFSSFTICMHFVLK